VDFQFLLDFFDRLARNVGGKSLDVIRNKFFEGVGQGGKQFSVLSFQL
jgi:hypothetical protein